MSPTRRNSNGRSPLVNKQSQITTFFSKSFSSPTSQTTPPSLLSKQTPNLPNPNSSPKEDPSSIPCAPSPSQSKPKKSKPLLFIPSTPAGPKSYGQEVVSRRIRVYWPLDGSWDEGCVKSFNKESGKHLIQYDDAEEELLDLGKEKFEWVEEGARQLKRLCRGGASLVKEEEAVKSESSGGGGDDSSDEDWGANVVKGMVEDVVEAMDMELVDEEDEHQQVGKKSGGKVEVRKRKGNSEEKLVADKKIKISGDVSKEGLKDFPEKIERNCLEMWSTGDKKTPCDLTTSLTADVSERFGMREAEKFRFLTQERRDSRRRLPGDADYDPKTLYLPPHFLKSLSDGQKQWWEFKSKHMDKVLFFKKGKFYELFEMDAHVGSKELGLQYMKGEQPQCGFPENKFSMNAEKLARKGYRVLSIEQTETPEQLEQRRKEKGSKDKVIKREICGVITKGTLTEGELLSANPDASYIMSLTENTHSTVDQKVERILGVCLVDVATSKIILGQIKDDLENSALRCLLTEVRPVEIIKPAKRLSSETEKVLLTHTRDPLVNELVPISQFWDSERTINELKSMYKRVKNLPESDESRAKDDNTLPEAVAKLSNDGDGNLALSALGGAIYYLRQAFLDETLIRFATFESFHSVFDDLAERHMVLDAAAMDNLEMFENSRNGDAFGTLFSQLNHCVTACGKRLLKTWLARPLYNAELIKERQDAIADLRGGNLPSSGDFRKALFKVPDMERLLARIYASSEARGRNANKVILYEDVAKKQLLEFISTLRGCEILSQACSSLSEILENTESRLLHHLLTPGQGLPDINPILKHFKDAFDWVEASNSGRIVPNEGIDTEYDSTCNLVKEVESTLMKHLKEQRKLLGDTSISYVTIGKDMYLLEVPEHLRGNVPREYELRSSKKGFFRYWTPTIKKLLSELSQAESQKETALKSILQRLLRQFCEHHNQWKQLVSVTTELDVLISLAIASDFFEGPTCRPTFVNSKIAKLSARSLGHPVLRTDSLGKSTFVPNDIDIGGNSARFILLSGPNMGGKSTLLRQVCLAVILAQIGADVPAESLELSPVDRIFVRMGAKDHIMAGQSTFLTELSETASMLSSATENSFVALDELGRGTSTSDGQAIAESVLKHFVHNVQCRGMFSTHYHRLAVNYSNDPGVSLRHMGCQVGDGTDGTEEVTFLYRLSPGACPKSYGVNVARLAGLPESILQNAARKSSEFEDSYGNRTNSFKLKMYETKEEMVVLMQKLLKIAVEATRFNHVPPKISLIGLQNKARMLLQQK